MARCSYTRSRGIPTSISSYLIGDTAGSLFYRPYRTDLRDLRGSARHRTAEGNPDRTSFAEDLHHDFPRPRAVVKVGKHDLLPGPQQHPPVRERHRV